MLVPSLSSVARPSPLPHADRNHANAYDRGMSPQYVGAAPAEKVVREHDFTCRPAPRGNVSFGFRKDDGLRGLPRFQRLFSVVESVLHMVKLLASLPSAAYSMFDAYCRGRGFSLSSGPAQM